MYTNRYKAAESVDQMALDPPKYGPAEKHLSTFQKEILKKKGEICFANIFLRHFCLAFFSHLFVSVWDGVGLLMVSLHEFSVFHIVINKCCR